MTTNICPVCKKEVEIQHTPAIDRVTGLRAHDYCLRIETQVHRSARATAKYINQVAEKHGIDLQAEMRKSEAVERTLAELRARQ